MDLTDCYDEAAKVLSYTRKITFDGKRLKIRDEFSTAVPAVAEMTIFSEVKNPDITANYPVKRSAVKFTDPKMINSWGEEITRTDISTGEKIKSGVVEVTLQ